MKKNSKNNAQYTKDWLEYQDHQYSPGHYTDGRVHPFYKYGGKKAAIWLLIGLIPALFVAVMSVLSASASGYSKIVAVVVWTLYLLPVILAIFITLFKKNKKTPR